MIKDAPGTDTSVDKLLGCLLGGAVGDALGWPVEFMTLEEIRKKYGPEGICDFSEALGGVGAITDDTQMTLFTAEGLLREFRRSKETGVQPDYPTAVYRAYLRWLYTQGEIPRDPKFRDSLDGDLLKVPALYHRRAPGNTCLSALISGKMGTVARPVNTSKGCGGIMRVAPVGLFCAAISTSGKQRTTAKFAFELGCNVAAITHGHPLGYLPAGYQASLISSLVSGKSLEEALSDAMLILVDRPEYEKSTLAAMISRALRRSIKETPSPETLERLGGGWVADEALVMSLYCALASKGDFVKGVRLAVNHSGDSDSTGSITGNILGAMMGKGAILEEWLAKLELREVTEGMGKGLFAATD
ncbi:MAG: ADP-ribosylglycohydrolase family protein [Deltaproteobacteria bacterium]